MGRHGMVVGMLLVVPFAGGAAGREDAGTAPVTVRVANTAVFETATLRDLAAARPGTCRLELVRFSGGEGEWRKLRPHADRLAGLAVESCPGFTVALLEHIARPDALRSLELSFVAVTDADLAHIARCRRLERLAVVSTRITDDGIARLAALTNLAWLRLGKNHLLTGKTLDRLAGLRALRELHVWETGIRGDDFAKLAVFPSLEALSVAKLIRHRGLLHLGRLVNLTWLDMGNSDIKNGDLHHLRSLELLEFLNLSFSTIDDGAVPYLKALVSLRTLIVGWTKISERGAAELAAALPRCRIIR